MLYIKALHIIFIVTWFAGLFYIVRLFVYHREAQDMPEPEKSILSNQFKIMEKRLWYGITWPSLFLTFILGFSLLEIMQFYAFGWMQVKLGFVFGLFVYQLWLHKIFAQFQVGIFNYSSNQLRLLNEVATIFLITIVFLIVGKNQIDYLNGFLGLVAIVCALLVAIWFYKKKRLGKS